MITLHTNFGDIKIELDTEKAPKTCANFKEYVRSGFYDGTIFHRVIDGFMIQGGGFEPGMQQKETQAPINNEADNGLTNVTGSLAMARTMDPHSASSQFFINDGLIANDCVKQPVRNSGISATSRVFFHIYCSNIDGLPFLYLLCSLF